VADCRGCEAEFLRCFFEAEVPGRGLEGAQRAEWWKPSHKGHSR
jgi:hypothetical protein